MPKLKISSCTVQLLDGTDIIVEVDKLQYSSELLDEVFKKVGIVEKGYFGLKYRNPKDSKDSWLDPNKPLHSQLKKASNMFKAAVQFYPPSIHMLEDEITRYNFVLQIRENLLTGEWSCTLPTHALLASYVAQAEFGDYDDVKHSDTYLNDLQFMPDQSSTFLDRVHAFHKKHVTVTATNADWMYLESARKIAMYGMNVMDVLDADGNVMKLGVNVNGVHVLHMNTILHSFLWPMVKKCYFHGQEFLLDLEYPVKGGHTEAMTIGFYALSSIESKRMTKTCNSYQQFAFHGKPKSTPGKAKSKGFRSKKAKHAREEVVEKECSHVTADTASTNFKRVDSIRFSKKILQQTSPQQKADKVKENVEPETSVPVVNNEDASKKTMEIPIITETLASDNPTSADEEGQEKTDKQQPAEETASPSHHEEEHASDEEPVEVCVEDIKVEDDIPDGEPQDSSTHHDEEYEDVTEEALQVKPDESEQAHEDNTDDDASPEVLALSPDVGTSDDVAHEETSDTSCDDAKTDNVEHDFNNEEKNSDENVPYDVETDQDIVIIEFEDVEEEISDKQKDDGSLLQEIEKELQQSAEKQM